MNEDRSKQIEELIGVMKCPRDFFCYKLGFGKLCKAEETKIGRVLVCLSKKPNVCIASRFMGKHYYCKCPLRQCITEKFEM